MLGRFSRKGKVIRAAVAVALLPLILIALAAQAYLRGWEGVAKYLDRKLLR